VCGSGDKFHSFLILSYHLSTLSVLSYPGLPDFPVIISLIK